MEKLKEAVENLYLTVVSARDIADKHKGKPVGPLFLQANLMLLKVVSQTRSSSRRTTVYRLRTMAFDPRTTGHGSTLYGLRSKQCALQTEGLRTTLYPLRSKYRAQPTIVLFGIVPEEEIDRTRKTSFSRFSPQQH
jgi:hypothetical protein